MPPQAPIEVIKSVLLLVEGVEDRAVFEAVARHVGIAERIQVEAAAGKTEIGAKLRAWRSTEGFKQVQSLGIVRDADDNARGAFQSVCGALQKADLPVPRQPMLTAGGLPNVTVMITPDNSSPGMLEDICLASIEADAAISCVETYFTCLADKQIQPENKAKALLHAFLASKPRPDLRLGEAAQKGYFPFEHPAFDQLRAFLKQLISA